MVLNKVFQDTSFGERLFMGYNMQQLPINGRHHMYEKQIDTWGKHVTIEGDTFTFHHPDMRDTVFSIDHPPGTYCCHDGAKIDIPPEELALPPNHPDTGKAARAYVAKHHKGKTSPDESNPSGYKVKNYFGVTVVSEK